MRSEVRILIVGGGVAGLATAWELGRRGERDVLLVEREPTLGAHSTGRNAAILRTFTGAEPSTSLALEGARFLAAPPAGFAPGALLERCGLVLVPDPARAAALASWRARKSPGSVVELDDPALRALVPGWRGATHGALLVRDEGRIDTAALVEGFARGARAAGVRIETGVGVRELLLDAGRVVGAGLDDGRRIGARQVALAAGGWAGELARGAGSRVLLRPLRRHLLVTAPDARVDPSAPVVWSDPDAFYARPESGGTLLCACDESEVAPQELRSDPAVREAIAERAARLLPPLADAGAAHFWAGLRTFAADREFVIGPDPDLPGLSWVAALGGHGMSTAAAVGRLAAQALLEAASVEPGCAPERLVPRSAARPTAGSAGATR